MSAEPQLLSLAAGGDRNAHSVLAIEALDAGRKGVVHPLEAWTAAELWGRLAAAHGEETDVLGLAGLLFKRSIWERENGRRDVAIALQGEVVLILDGLADLGSEEAAKFLSMAGAALDPVAFDVARGGAIECMTVDDFAAEAERMEAAGAPNAKAVGLAAMFYQAQEMIDRGDTEAASVLERGIRALRESAEGGDAQSQEILAALRRGIEGAE